MLVCARGCSATAVGRCLPRGVAKEVAAMRAPCASRTKNTMSAEVAAFTSRARTESTTFVATSAPSGALVATKVVDSVLARDVKAATSADIVFFVRDAQGARIAATSFATPLGKHLPTAVAEQPRAHTSIGGTRYATQGAAVTTAGGEVVGGYVVMTAHDA